MAASSHPPAEVQPPPSSRRYWTRKGLAEWLADRLSEPIVTVAGIDHGFSFPLRYFKEFAVRRDWPGFLDDFCRHWPTDEPDLYVEFVRDGMAGNAAARSGDARWRRLTEVRSRTAKSVFHFDVPGSVAKATHTGLPWLRYIRQRCGASVHFWPFDGWLFPSGKSVVAEVYPSLWTGTARHENWTADQQDAYKIVEWLQHVDNDGSLGDFFYPALSPDERARAEIEGWILGVA